MVALDQKKNKLLYLVEIFEKYTDENHKLTLEEITNHLKDFGIDVERKTLYKDMKILEGFGYEILKFKDKTTRYYLNSRLFELAELKLLVDSVQSSKFITEKKSKQIIDKLQTLTSSYNADSLNRNIVVENRLKSENERMLYVTDNLHMAMFKGKSVIISYRQFYLENFQGKSKIRRSSKRYNVDPLVLEFQSDNYYLLAFDPKDECLKHFRVDKIFDVKVLDDEISEETKINYLDITKHNKITFNMFSGDEELLRMKFHTDCLSAVIDRFGLKMNIEKSTKDSFIIYENVAVSPTFYGWLANFGEKAEILEPSTEREKFKSHIKNILGNY